jgi:hypothetical protein
MLRIVPLESNFRTIFFPRDNRFSAEFRFKIPWGKIYDKLTVQLKKLKLIFRGKKLRKIDSSPEETTVSKFRGKTLSAEKKYVKSIAHLKKLCFKISRTVIYLEIKLR